MSATAAEVMAALAASDLIGERRVATLTTFGFLNRGDASTSLEIATILLGDAEGRIRKALGWMLREIGRRVEPALLLTYLDDHAASMSRTTLSYATEYLTSEQCLHYRGLR